MLSVPLMATLARSANVNKDMMEILLLDVLMSMSATTKSVAEMLFVSTSQEALIVVVNLITRATHLMDVSLISH